MKKIITAIFLLLAVCSPVFAEETVFNTDIVCADGTVCSTTAFRKAGDLWVAADGLKTAGLMLNDALNGKGYTITVNEPDKLFGILVLKQLTGNSIKLYFPGKVVQKIKYFNITGLERITGFAEDKTSERPLVKAVQKETAVFADKSANEVNKPIVLAWEHVTAFNPDLAKEAATDSFNVLSPTWFNLADQGGLTANRASVSYAAEAHRRGCQVWALVSNSFNTQMTTAFLKNSYARKQFIAQLLIFAKLYGLDGFNFDFEKIDLADRDLYTLLLRETAPYLKEAGLVLSVDVYKPANTKSSKSHDRKAFSAIADYIMVMAYDQHWRTSPQAGSVADLPWTADALIKTLEEVPAEKLLLGIPFYMRRWNCTLLPDGKEKVSSQVLTMAQSDELISKHSITPVWLEDKGQNYYEFTEDGKKVKVWVENAQSAALRGALVKRYGLAGVACWRKGMEASYIWPALLNSLK